jgi:hypothetical protein
MRIVRNKAKLGRAAVSGGRRVDGARCGKQSQFPAGPGGTGSGDEDREGQSCKTNPIFATSGGSRAGTPNLRRADCAKRSQTWAGWDIWGTARRGRPNGAKRTQFPATPGGMGLEGRATRSKRAKRTQFGRACAGPGLQGTKDAKRTQFAWSAAAPEGEMRETNPICGKRPDLGLGCTNKANSARANRDGWWPAGADVLYHRRQSCETNPISCRRRVGRGVLYKQTQFLPFCRSGDRRSREGRSCKTNPISGRAGGTRDKYAKRTQSAWRGRATGFYPVQLEESLKGKGLDQLPGR